MRYHIQTQHPNYIDRSEDDYNLDEEVLKTPPTSAPEQSRKPYKQDDNRRQNYGNRQPQQQQNQYYDNRGGAGGEGGQRQQRQQPQQQYDNSHKEVRDDNRAGGSSGMNRMFKGREGTRREYFSDEENEFNPRTEEQEQEIQEYMDVITNGDQRHFQDYKESSAFKIQQELIALIRQKIGTQDRDKARYFLKKLSDLAGETELLIDDITYNQIEVLLREKQVLDDKSAFQAYLDSVEDGDKILPSKYEASGETEYYPTRGLDEDTSREPPLENMLEYEDRILQSFVKEIDVENHHLQKLNGVEIDILDSQELDDVIRYQDLLQDVRENIQEANFNEIDEFSRKNLISSEVSQFEDIMNLIKTEKGYTQGLKLPDSSVTSPEAIENIAKLDRIDLMEELKIAAEIEQDLGMDLMHENKSDLKHQYQQIKNLANLNTLLRDQLLQRTKVARQTLALVLRDRDSLLNKLEVQAKDHQSDAIPQKFYDFTGKEKLAERIKRIKQIYYKNRQYDPKSSDVENFNAELSYLVKTTLVDENINKPKNLDLFEQVIAQMNKNNVEPNMHTHARLGFLQAYVEKLGLNIEHWPLKNFKSALDYYLNYSFNLKHLLIFTNYYTYYHTCRLNSELKKMGKTSIDQLSKTEKFALNREVFKENQSLVDMRAFFGHLVQEIGQKDAIDAVTKEDAIWKIIEFFTKRGTIELARMSESLNNTIDEKDIATYFKNHINGSKTFERVTQVILRLNDSNANGTFQNHILQYLKEYQAREGSLPFSFDSQKIRKAYIQMKNARQKNQNVKISEKTLEYFLYLFKQQQMWAEIIDLCENYHNLSQTNAAENSFSEIKSYYLSDSLLQIPANQHYHKLIPEAVYQNQEPLTAGYITSMTKAYFKDGSISHAVHFFQDSINELRQLKEQRETLLLNMFDSIYSEENPRDLSYDQFKRKYLNMILLSNRFVKESFAVGQLRRVLKDKDYDEIERLFQLYLVEKEETQVLSQVYSPDEVEEARQMPVQEIDGLNEQMRERMQAIRERRQALRSQLSEKDAENMIQLYQVMKDSKVRLFKDLDGKSADEIQQVFNLMNKDQVDEILERTQPLYQAATNLLYEDKDSAALGNFEARLQEEQEDLLDKQLDVMFEHRSFPSRGIAKTIERVYESKWRQRPRGEQRLRAEHELNQLNRYLYQDEVTEEEDPEVIARTTHNRTLADMKEELLHAVNNRRGKVLNLTLEIFNKVQEQQVKTLRLSDIEKIDAKTVVQNKEAINEQLTKLNILLNDERSPLYSALQTVAQYKGDSDIMEFEEYFEDDFTSYGDRDFDIDTYRRQNVHLKSLNEQLGETYNSIVALKNHLLKQNLEKERSTFPGQPQKQNDPKDQSFQKFNKQKSDQLKQQLEVRIKTLYQEYKQSLSNNTEVSTADELPREDKLQLVRDVFTVEYEDSFTNNLFPAFYSQDLIVFGLENRIAEAVRLGERMMSENNQTLSPEMQQAVKDFMLSHSDLYHAAIKTTGPIDNSSLYKSTSRNLNKDETPVIFSHDDPYWQELISKTKRRIQKWRRPSILAWDHKKYGLVGEVLDMKRIDEVSKQMRQEGRIF